VGLNKLDASELGALLKRVVVSLNLKAIINHHRVRKRTDGRTYPKLMKILVIYIINLRNEMLRSIGAGFLGSC